jgi:integrase
VKFVRAALHQLLRCIEAEAPLSIKSPVRLLPVDVVVRDFDQHLEGICGLSINTRRYQRRYAREFLIKNFGRGAVKWDQLRPVRIMKFVTDYARRCSPATGEVAASAIRSLIRFGQFHGFCDDRLIKAVPGIPVWKRIRNPKTLTVDQLNKVLDIFDRSTASGQRDYAMAVCMADLGLRASEVAGLRFEDIDWDQATARLVAPKGHRDRVLPLSRRVGAALAIYLRRGRPRSRHRQVFVQHRAPLGEPVSALLVHYAMCRAYRRAGLDPTITGTHVLRHTAASLMYQRGATLKEIADVLGHQSLDTTAIYAKVNWAQLRKVALPWPEVRS